MRTDLWKTNPRLRTKRISFMKHLYRQNFFFWIRSVILNFRLHHATSTRMFITTFMRKIAWSLSHLSSIELSIRLARAIEFMRKNSEEAWEDAILSRICRRLELTVLRNCSRSFSATTKYHRKNSPLRGKLFCKIYRPLENLPPQEKSAALVYSPNRP